MSQFCQPSGLREKGITAGLQYIDCNSEQVIQYAFNRFFGPDGVLGWALTIILTIYVALIAFRLLSGRGRLSALPPRILGLGLILTFATSWVGYQSFVLNIALGAPEELARLLLNTKGSATYAFSRQLDVMFQSIAQVALQSRPAGGGEAAVGVMSAEGDLLWMAALMLLLATVGVLIVARMAMALMLALGPIFIILALFSGTRGLFVGWMKTVVMLAVAPLFAVLLGGGTITLIRPLVQELARLNGAIDMRIAVNIFLAASVHVALMLMALKLSTTLVSGWQLPWFNPDDDDRASADPAASLSVNASEQAMPSIAAVTNAPLAVAGDPRTQSILRSVEQSMSPSLPEVVAGRSGFARGFGYDATDGRDAGGASRERRREVQALGRKYRSVPQDTVRLKRERTA
jgi:type IV secretion system protein VirB6